MQNAIFFNSNAHLTTATRQFVQQSYLKMMMTLQACPLTSVQGQGLFESVKAPCHYFTSAQILTKTFSVTLRSCTAL